MAMKEGGGGWRLFTNLNTLFFVNKKQGKWQEHRENREFVINWSVATLNTKQECKRVQEQEGDKGGCKDGRSQG